MLPVTETIREKIVSETSAEEIRQVAIAEGMVNLRENAIIKLLDGTTTYQEVLRVTWEQL